MIFVPLLSACASTMDSKVSLSGEFESASDVYVIEKPLGRVFDSVYNKKIGSYSVLNADTSFRKLKDKLVSSEDKENLIGYFLLGSKHLYVEVEEFNVTSTIDFSFDIENDKSEMHRARCRIISLSMDERREAIITTEEDKRDFPNFPSDKSVNDRSARSSTHLSCSITYGDESLDLNLFSNKSRKTNITLTGGDDEVIVKSIPIYTVIDENYNQYDYEDQYYAINSGLEFHINNEQLSALSFVGKPRVWLKNDMSEDKKQLLLTISYSLFMFDWLDYSWR
jgi:hypothetical protein